MSKLVMNSTDKEVLVRAYGNYFRFEPGKIKIFEDHIANFLTDQKAYLGLIDVPAKFEELDARATEEGKQELEAIRRNGLQNRINYLKGIVNNLTISLQKDLDQKGYKTDALKYATDGEIAAMREMKELQRANKDDGKKNADAARKLLHDIRANDPTLIEDDSISDNS